MSRFVYYTAVTITGQIADRSHSLDWLFEVPPEDAPDFSAFLAPVTAIVMGRSTWDWLDAHGGLEPSAWREAHGRRPVWLFTHRPVEVPAGIEVHVRSGNVGAQADALRASGGDVWIVGGGDLVGQFLDAGILDELQLSFAPVALRAGAPVLPRELRADTLELADVSRRGQFAHLTYRVRH